MTGTEKVNALLRITNFGADERKEFLNKAAEAYNNGKQEHSIFYQVQFLFNMLQERYFDMPTVPTKIERKCTAFGQMQLDDANKVINDKFTKYLIEKKGNVETTTSLYHDILKTNIDPLNGFKEIVDKVKQFPYEWTILQVCKAPRPQTTYSDFQRLHEHESDIYLTILKHARSSAYPEPICLRLSAASQVELFKIYSKISAEYKEYMQVDANNVKTHEDKAKYWENLKSLDRKIRQAIVELKQYIFPWLFLFKGIPRRKIMKDCFLEVDKLCKTLKLGRRECVLLSLACLHANDFDDEEIEAFCEELSSYKKIQAAASQLIRHVRGFVDLSASPNTIFNNEEKKNNKPKNYPCILIVDEQLDHIFWEELNVAQEMCRVNSLHCLWKLFTTHRSKIKKGYLCVGIKEGGCVLNPDNNLPKTEMRLRAFFEYWTPSWLIKCKEKPSQDELMQDFLKRSCYVYAGHGSGLHHLSGKRISKQHTDAVVFLFGCDSTRMHSNGLYSDLIGPHIFYHAALCPCLVGSILPALDSKMDSVAVEILSRWITPETKDLCWQNIDIQLWIKKGIVKQAQIPLEEEKKDERIGSLCSVLTSIHKRGSENFYYNTVPYVCRGIPVWNSNVEPLPE